MTTIDIEIRNSTMTGKFYCSSKLQLSGLGIKQCGDGSTHARGLKTYHITKAALEKLKGKYTTQFCEN